MKTNKLVPVPTDAWQALHGSVKEISVARKFYAATANEEAETAFGIVEDHLTHG